MATVTNRVRSGEASRDARHALQHVLQQEQQLLRERMGALRESARGDRLETTDAEERAEGLVDFGVGLAALGLTTRTLQRIETALQRFDVGTYGVCLDCSGRIEPARLRALPFAELCRGCQEQRDGAPGGRVEAI